MKKLTLEKIQERVEALIPETMIGIDTPPKGKLPGSPSSKKTSEKPPKLAKKIYKLTAANYKGIGLSAPVDLKKGSSARGPYDAFFDRCEKSVDLSMTINKTPLAHPDSWNPYGLSGWCGVSKDARTAIKNGKAKGKEWRDDMVRLLNAAEAKSKKNELSDDNFKTVIYQAQGVADWLFVRGHWWDKDEKFSCDGGAGKGASEENRYDLAETFQNLGVSLNKTIISKVDVLVSLQGKERSDQIKSKKDRQAAIDKAIADERARQKAEDDYRKEQERKAIAAQKAEEEEIKRQKAAKAKEEAEKRRRNLDTSKPLFESIEKIFIEQNTSDDDKKTEMDACKNVNNPAETANVVTALNAYRYLRKEIWRGVWEKSRDEKRNIEQINDVVVKVQQALEQPYVKVMAQCKSSYLSRLENRLSQARNKALKGAEAGWPKNYGRGSRRTKAKSSKTYGELGWRPDKRRSKAGDSQFDQFYADLEKAKLLDKLGKRKKDYNYGSKHRAAYRALVAWASKNNVKLGAKPEPEKLATEPKPEKRFIWCGDPSVTQRMLMLWNKNRESMGLDPLRSGDCQERGKAVIRTGRYMGLSFKEMKMIITGNEIERDLEKRRPSIDTATREKQILEAKEDALRLYMLHDGFTDEDEEKQIEQIVRKHIKNKTIGLLDNLYARTHQMRNKDQPMTLRQMLNHEGSGSGGAESLRRLAQEVEVALSRPTRGAEYRTP